jgi:hypothetical protein|eukprot:CAMPEP_0169096270 /NCGR_PEP_ID=MMETSP1015-20121227/18909_1 /TAXON_ID=342587 /ORGANISM="Karlodinium micrum, Strain CCMP2283" /LENGTH=566 /DNA_ID=CAMNT_0009157023 /DNA_START=40 /DNA_END=1740 /DNA_ORIENTATION=+
MWLYTIVIATSSGLADANAFLGQVQTKATGALSAHSEQVLLAELGNALGSGHRHSTEKRIKRIEQMLSPMFGAMAKNEHGRLGPPAAGYMLHRVFVQRHGWFIRALEPANGSFAAWNTSTPTAILEERVPDHVTQLFESRLGQHGLGLKELAVLAATLEHLVHIEALQRLNVSFEGAGINIGDDLSKEEANVVLDMYMAIYILGFMHEDLSTLTGDMAKTMHDNILALYPTWPETQQFLREVFQSVAPQRDYMYFSDMETVIAEIGERYGRFQDIECRQLKDWLVEVEDTSVGGAGRVRVADFYSRALNDGKWQFSETVDYLRQLGALDESDAENPRVIIPNYISGPSNCVASSAYYSVCCLDECENILGQLEQIVAAPEATPERITSVISMIPSATVPSNRSLSPWLHHRLDEVANHHGGLVPLHGRLFSQWLHYAYPRECQFPHISGTISPERPEDKLMTEEVASEEISCSAEEMKRIVEAAPPKQARLPGAELDAESESAMWSLHEELVVWRQVGGRASYASMDLFAFGRGIAAIGAVMSFALAIIRNASPKVVNAPAEKYYV